MTSKFEHNSWYASPKIVIFLKNKILGEGAKFVFSEQHLHLQNALRITQQGTFFAEIIYQTFTPSNQQ